MAWQFSLEGAWGADPMVGGSTSGIASVDAQIDEKLVLAQRNLFEITLASDSATPVTFGGVTNAHVVLVKTSAKVKVRLTSADGSTQSIPVDGVLYLITKAVPITAIDLTRVPATSTLVKVFLGEKA